MNFVDTIIPSCNKQKGNFNKAEELIRENILSNHEISKESGVSEPRLNLLRRKIRAHG
jgi:hypothetical protein